VSLTSQCTVAWQLARFQLTRRIARSLGDSWASCSTVLFIYFTLFTLPQKNSNSNCCTVTLAVYLLLFSASYYLHSPSTASALQEERVYWYGRVEACGSGLLRHGLNFSTVWCTMRLISVEKTGSMYPCRRWSLWTLAVMLLAWHSSCHKSQPVLFRAADDNPQLALFRLTASNVWKNPTYLQSDEKVLHFLS